MKSNPSKSAERVVHSAEILDGVADPGGAAAQVDHGVPVAALRNADPGRQATIESAAIAVATTSAAIARIIMVAHHKDIALVVAVHPDGGSCVEILAGVHMRHSDLLRQAQPPRAKAGPPAQSRAGWFDRSYCDSTHPTSGTPLPEWAQAPRQPLTRKKLWMCIPVHISGYPAFARIDQIR